MQPLRCDFCGGKHRNGYCEDFLVISPEDEDIFIMVDRVEESQDIDSYLKEVLVEFLEANQVSLDRYEVQCLSL